MPTMCIPVLQVHLETGHSYRWMTKKMMWINKKLLTIYNGRIHMPSHTKDKIYTTGFYIISAVIADISGVTAAHILAPYPPLLPSNLHKGASKSQFKKLHGRA